MRRIACHRLIPLEDSLNIDRARFRRGRGFVPSVGGNSNVAEAMTMAVELELKRISDLLDFKKALSISPVVRLPTIVKSPRKKVNCSLR